MIIEKQKEAVEYIGQSLGIGTDVFKGFIKAELVRNMKRYRVKEFEFLVAENGNVYLGFDAKTAMEILEGLRWLIREGKK